jgi:predicted nuclease with TOPRIM domain
MMHGPLFIPKEFIIPPGFDDFKEKVEWIKKELAEQKAKQAIVDAHLERMESKQDAMADDLKKLISLLTPKP